VLILTVAAAALSLSFNLSNDPGTLNPLLTLPDAGASALIVERLVFEPFVDLDEHGRVTPVLLRQIPTLANGGLSRDGRTITYHLRPKVRWHDGAPVTSGDVLFTWRAIMDPRNPVRSREGYELIERIATPDALTAIVHLRAPWSPAVASLFSYGGAPQFVLPAHLFAGSTDVRESGFNAAPVGDGPYRIVAWKRGAQIDLQAFDGYWRGKPKTGQLHVGIVPAPETNLVELRSGALDWNLIAPVQERALAGAQDLRFSYAPTALSVGLALNTKRPPLDDAALRRALAMAIDRAAISAKITLGRYPVIDSDQPRFSWAYDPTVKLPPYDPAASDAAFDRAGWHRGTNGMREKDGKPLELTYVQFPESTTGVRVSIAVQEMLRGRGVAVIVKSISNAQLFLPAARGGVLWSGDFDLAYVPWTMSADPDDSYIVTCHGAANFMRYCNATVDALENKALATPEQTMRRRLYGRIARIVAGDVPVIWLFNPSYIYAYRDRVRGFAPNPIVPTWNAFEWSL